MFLPHTNHTQTAERAKECHFVVHGDFDLDLKIPLSKDQTRLLCEFGANPFSSSQNVSYTNKKPQTDGARNRTFHSSLRVVKIQSCDKKTRRYTCSHVSYSVSVNQTYCSCIHTNV